MLDVKYMTVGYNNAMHKQFYISNQRCSSTYIVNSSNPGMFLRSRVTSASQAGQGSGGKLLDVQDRVSVTECCTTLVFVFVE